MERTQSFVIHPAFSQRDEIRHHIHNVGGIHYTIYGTAVYHSNIQIYNFLCNLQNKGVEIINEKGRVVQNGNQKWSFTLIFFVCREKMSNFAALKHLLHYFL